MGKASKYKQTNLSATPAPTVTEKIKINLIKYHFSNMFISWVMSMHPANDYLSIKCMHK